MIEHRYILNEMDVITRSIPDGLHSVVAMLVNFCESMRNNETTIAGLQGSITQEKVRQGTFYAANRLIFANFDPNFVIPV